MDVTRMLLVAGLMGLLACGTTPQDTPDTPNDLGTHEVSPTDTGTPNDTVQGGDVDGGKDGAGAVTCRARPAIAPMTDFFVDVSIQSGIQVGNHNAQPAQPIPINDHSRLAVVDLNGDGWDDIVAHSLFPNPQAGIPFEHLVFINQKDGTFADFSDASGLRFVAAGFFVFGDVDNDGDQDVFAGLDIPLPGKTHQILLNDGTGRFTPRAGSGVDAVDPTVAGNGVFADFNGDGRLDLYIGNGHTGFQAPDLYFEGGGDGTFVPASSKLVGNTAQPTNGSVACDIDDDGDLDIVVSTYGVSAMNGLNILWENQGGSFTNVAVARGFASLPGGNPWLNLYDTEEAGKGPGTWMGSNGFGLACEDVNNDGYMDIFLTAISHPVMSDYNRKWSDTTQLLINQGPTQGFVFVDESRVRGVPFNEGDVDGASVDFDNDGWLDLSISRDKKYEKNYAELDQKAWFGLMRQASDGSFISMGPVSGLNALDAAITASLTTCTSDAQCTTPGEACLKERCRVACTDDSACTAPHEMCHSGGFCKLKLTMKNAQNHAWFDFDRDGDLDLLVGGRDTGGGRPNFLFRNDIGHQNRWLALKLVGDGVTVNRDAIGARVSMVFSDRTLSREVKSSRGMHASADTRWVNFGLGDASCDYTLWVRWPDGTKVSFAADALGEEREWTLTYPDTLAPAIR